jgi:hypothetical protein
MPFKSQSQRRFMWSQHPKLAKEFAAATPSGKKLPEKLHPDINPLKKYLKSKRG